MEHSDKEIRTYFRNVFGFRIKHPDVYRTALTHRSAANVDAFCGRLNNERLEYLGDAVLGAVVADFLFHKYPLEDEGSLTRMRSKLVCRNRLNALACKIGLHDMIRIHAHAAAVYADGNAFEAVVGAIYVDQGFKKTYNILINNIILVHLDIDAIHEVDDDFKSRIMIWAQKTKHNVHFTSELVKKERQYRSCLAINGELYAEGMGISVKKAEQAAAEKALNKMKESNA